MLRPAALLPLLALVLATGCAKDPPSADPSADPLRATTSDSPRLGTEADGPEAPDPRTVFDAAEAVFDTMEPPPALASRSQSRPRRVRSHGPHARAPTRFRCRSRFPLPCPRRP